VSQALDQLERAARDWLLASTLVHLVFLIHVDKRDQANEFNEIMKSQKRPEIPGQPNLYFKYKEFLDGAEEDFDPDIYCNRRSYLYKKTGEDLAKIFAGSESDVNGLEKEIGAWHAQKFPLYDVNSATFYIYGRSRSNAREIEEKAHAVYWAPEGCEQYTLDELSETINTNDLFADGTNESVKLLTVPLRRKVDIGIKWHIQKQIEVIVEDLKDAYEAWKQLYRN
jgi:hypothetical protein